MGKKRKNSRVSLEEKLEIIGDEIVEAAEWLNDSSPFEVTCELARLGVKTVNQDEVRRFFDEWQPRKVDGEFIPPFEELLMHWEAEILSSTGSKIENISDTTLLCVVSEYFWDAYENDRLGRAILETEMNPM